MFSAKPTKTKAWGKKKKSKENYCILFVLLILVKCFRDSN